ncbi:hypothetical protein BPTFM16_02682 [Altererythrobacter insulae]|nr:hypothetical protein BPTFM16_02682 [Altererythrobacter insulae]
MRAAHLGLVLMAAALVVGCEQEPQAPDQSVTAQMPERTPADTAPEQQIEAAAAAELGTPMQDRIATLGLLNKRNNSSQDIQITPGETQTFGDIRISLSACERTAPWEMQRETGAFVQVDVQPRGSNDFERIFSGWLFKESPSLSVVEHPIYDVWVKDCAMSFPGEE